MQSYASFNSPIYQQPQPQRYMEQKHPATISASTSSFVPINNNSININTSHQPSHGTSYKMHSTQRPTETAPPPPQTAQHKPVVRKNSRMMEPFLDPFQLTNPCCCCCGTVSIINGVKTVATVSMVVALGYGMLGAWFAFNALLPEEHALIKGNLPEKESSDKLVPNDHEGTNFVEILLICSIASLIGGVIRFLASLFLLRSIEKESKTAAKLWVFITYFLVIVVTAVVLAASQKNDVLFSSLTMTIFLGYAGVDFLLLLYFLWVIIVYVKEAIDMPGL